MGTKKKWIDSEEMLELSEMLKAIAHPSRMTIMFLLCNSNEKRMTVKSIYDEMKMSQPVISRHLSILKNGGLVKRVIQGSKTFYELKVDNKNVERIALCFSSLN
jgi:ArsR family transcriptional regulator